MDYFDPDGDVTLEVGQELKAHFVVSSKVMSLASPVFKAMFSPQFREGSELAAGIRKPIPLPDDDPDGMAIICGILHHKTDGVPARPSLEIIGDVAVLCDKYNIGEATHGWTRAWLPIYSNIFKSTKMRVETFSLLWITSALDNAEYFTAISRTFILSYRNDVELPSLDLQQYSVIPELIKKAKEYKEETLAKYSCLLAPLFSCISYPEKPADCTKCRVTDCKIANKSMSCPVVINKTLFCISESNKTGLTICPNPTVLTLSSIIMRLSKFRSFEENARFCGYTDCSCSTDIESQIRLMGERLLKDVKGLCLDCFGKGRTKKGACRVEDALHRKPNEEVDTADTT